MADEITLFDAYGRAIEKRATSKHPEDWLLEAFGATKSTAGERITPAIAMTVMAFFACVRNISEDIAKLPKKVRRTLNPGNEYLPDHPVNLLMRAPSRYMNRHVFWQTLISHALTYHGGFAYIVRNGAGQPIELVLLDPQSVQVRISYQTGEHYYHVTGMRANEVLFPSEVIHLMGLSHTGIDGFTMPMLAKQLLGAAVALQKYRGSFFGNGAAPSGVLTHPALLSAEASERLRRQFMSRYAGAENAHGIVTLEEGMTWAQTSIDPERAQMVELTNVTVEDICRIYRMPPHKIQHLANATFSNIEHQGLEYDRDTLDPWADKLRAELEFKLLTMNEVRSGVHVYVNLNALMRADVATRTQHYKEMYYMGAYSANRVLELEDENPVPDGNRRFVQQNLIPADRVDDILDAKAAPPSAPAAPAAEKPAPTAAFQRVLEYKIADILRVELQRARSAKDPGDYYKKHEGFVEEHITCYIGTVLDGLCIAANARAIAAEYAAIHCAESLRYLELGDMTEWQDGSRARYAAECLMEEITTCNIAA